MYATLDANAAMASLTLIEKMMLIRQVPIFAELDADDLEELAAIVEERRVDAGKELFREGDAGDAVYLIVKGTVRVFVGGPAPTGRSARSASSAPARASARWRCSTRRRARRPCARLERTRTLRVPGEGFKRVMSERPEMSAGDRRRARAPHARDDDAGVAAGGRQPRRDPTAAGVGLRRGRPASTLRAMKRDTTAVIWRTVVFAGAMLGAPACSKSKPATTTPSNASAKTGDNGMAPTNGSAATPKPDPDAGNPCAGGPDPRPRGTDIENGGGEGRGFVLS